MASITTYDDVQWALKQIELSLVANDMPQFHLFNAAYAVVTTHIQQAAAEGYFDNPQFIEQFTVTFATYYFRAINDMQTANKDIPAAWSALSKLHIGHSPRFISLLLGANAHINDDLPQALFELMADQKTDALLGDVVKIDKLLMRSGKDIIGLFDEPSSKLDYLKRHCVWVYYRPVMYMILYWRVIAWKNYRKMKKDRTALHHVHKRSSKIAMRLLRVARLLEIKQG